MQHLHTLLQRLLKCITNLHDRVYLFIGAQSQAYSYYELPFTIANNNYVDKLHAVAWK